MSNRKFFVTKDKLQAMLAENTAQSIGEEFGVGKSTVLYWAHKYGLKVTPAYGKVKDITGEKFGRLTAIEMIQDPDRLGTYHWLCKCDCGSTKIVDGSSLRTGITKSCGCISFEKSWKGYGKLSATYWNRIMKGAQKRKLEFSISMKDAWELYESQKRHCALSGVPIQIITNYTRKHREHTASLDRIDHDKGYTKDNIQWVHRDINMMRRTMPIENFIDICKKVANNARSFSSH